MSTLFMTKRCQNCHRRFTYNPSVGDFGLICRHCGMPQIKIRDEGKLPYEPKLDFKITKFPKIFM